jgi:hypothetical protein
MKLQRTWNVTKETLTAFAAVATIAGLVLTYRQVVSKHDAKQHATDDESPARHPGVHALNADTPGAEVSASVIAGLWRLPLSGRLLRIDAQEQSSARFLVSDDEGSVGFGDIQHGVVSMHLRLPKVGSERSAARDAYLVLRLSADGERLSGDFHGEDPSELGPVIWLRHHS